MPKTLLLADDSVTIQKVVGISFANEDIRIVTVDNGDDAVTRAREIRPDIVLADIVMPGKSGYDVCAALKGDPALAHIPVLLLTGTFETFDEERAARVGADGHITKPFEAQALVELVSARLASVATARSASSAAPAAKPATEPEPFDFLEPEAVTPSPLRSTGTARPAPAASANTFAFEAEPLETIDLDTADEGEIDLGNEATAARTTLLLDEEDPFLEHATTAPPRRPATAPPVSAPPVRSGTAPPVRTSTAPPVGGGSGASALRPAPAAKPFSAEFDGASELTHLVLPLANEPEPAAAAEPVDGDPLSGLEEFSDSPFASSPSRPEWDVVSNEFDDPSPTDVFGERATTSAARVHDDATPAGSFTTPLFDDDDASTEFELTELAAPAPRPSPPSSAAPAAAVAAPTPELSGAMRDQVHATIEKIAWEALGDVSERIVREAVARIEQVAWDVIPRLTETLIREEIRKLKGEE